MSLITLPDARWTQKPPPGTDLDRRHPSCPDHCWPFLSPQGTAQCLAKNARLSAPTTLSDIYAGSSTYVVGRKYGLAVRHAATTDILRLTADSSAEVNKVLPLAGGHTLLLAYRKTDATARGQRSFGLSSQSGSDNYHLMLPWSNGDIYWVVAQFIEGSGRLTIPAATVTALGINFQVDHLWLFTVGLRGMEVWLDGQLLGSNSGNPTRTTLSTDRLAFPAQSSSDLADLSLVMTWRRQLTAAEIRALAINPWHVFQPRTTLIATTVSAPVGTTVPALLLAP